MKNKIADTLEFIITEKFIMNPLHDMIYKVQMYHVVDVDLMIILTLSLSFTTKSLRRNIEN